MPNWMTNGQAATNTAIAISNAFKSTQNWFGSNPDANEIQIGKFLDASINIQMAIFGGSMTYTEPFKIPSPAPYVTSLISTGNCN